MDLEIANYLNSIWAGTFVDSFTRFISSYLFLWILWSVLTLLVYFLDKKNHGEKVLLAVIIAVIFHFLISDLFFKNLLGSFFELRIRPYLAYPDLITLIGRPHLDASFPSSHMTSTVAILSVYTYFYKKVWPFALLFVIAMGFARIHNGLHYPTDVLGGTILGIAYGLTAVYLSKKIVKLAK